MQEAEEGEEEKDVLVGKKEEQRIINLEKGRKQNAAENVENLKEEEDNYSNVNCFLSMKFSNS